MAVERTYELEVDAVGQTFEHWVSAENRDQAFDNCVETFANMGIPIERSEIRFIKDKPNTDARL